MGPSLWQEIQKFPQANGIMHTRCAPYQLSSNGQAERFVKTVKHGLQLCMRDNPKDSAQLC